MALDDVVLSQLSARRALDAMDAGVSPFDVAYLRDVVRRLERSQRVRFSPSRASRLSDFRDALAAAERRAG